MKRTIPRSLVSKAAHHSTESTDRNAEAKMDTAPSSTPGAFKGAGSAWKAGALAQSQAAVEQGRAQLVDDILNGHHELHISPDQVEDPLGSDRRDDWMAQEAFQTLLKSIDMNGQDTPILVWPEDPNWKPDPLNPTDVGDVRFIMLTGRRRHAAAKALGRKLRAILASPDKRGREHSQFEMLFLRFRENEERENLGAFERLLAIGEMYETLREAGDRTTAVAFAERIGVHESIVSRARAVFGARVQILNAFKNAYDMSFQDLQKAMASLEGTPKKHILKPVQKLTAKRKVGSRNLSLTSTNGNLLIKAASVPLSQENLEELSDLIADFLTKAKEVPPTV
jgi:ParB family chromosome partitioning protein